MVEQNEVLKYCKSVLEKYTSGEYKQERIKSVIHIIKNVVLLASVILVMWLGWRKINVPDLPGEREGSSDIVGQIVGVAAMLVLSMMILLMSLLALANIVDQYENIKEDMQIHRKLKEKFGKKLNIDGIGKVTEKINREHVLLSMIKQQEVVVGEKGVNKAELAYHPDFGIKLTLVTLVLENGEEIKLYDIPENHMYYRDKCVEAVLYRRGWVDYVDALMF